MMNVVAQIKRIKERAKPKSECVCKKISGIPRRFWRAKNEHFIPPK